MNQGYWSKRNVYWSFVVFRKETVFPLCIKTPLLQCVCRCSKCAPKYVVENAEGEAIFTVEGPICACQCICCPRDIDFPVSNDLPVTLNNASDYQANRLLSYRTIG